MSSERGQHRHQFKSSLGLIRSSRYPSIAWTFQLVFVLSQEHEGKQHLICFGGPVLRGNELKWHIGYHFYFTIIIFLLHQQ